MSPNDVGFRSMPWVTKGGVIIPESSRYVSKEGICSTQCIRLSIALNKGICFCCCCC